MNGTVPRTRGRKIKTALIVTALLALVGAVLVAYTVIPVAAQKTETETPSPKVATATVVRGDLTETSEFPGTLAYGTATTLRGTGAGIITWLPPVGTILDRGTVCYRQNEIPVPVFIGDIPLYRPLDTNGLTGADVLMVAANLSAGGFYDAAVPTEPAKAVWSHRLTRAVKKWQKAIGAPVTGIVTPGDVVVLPAAARVNATVGTLGGSAGGDILSITGVNKAVSVPVKAVDSPKFAVGTAVTAVLPDGQEIPATVTAISTVAQSPEDDSGAGGGMATVPTITVTVVPDAQEDVALFDYAEVFIRAVTASREGVLIAPVEALLALSEGGYALEQPDGTLVPVTLGMFAGALVEVSGEEVSEGLTVVTAS